MKEVPHESKNTYARSLYFLCCLLLSSPAFALSGSDIELAVRSPVNSLTNESGVIAVEQFPAEIEINATAKTGALTGVQLEFNGWTQKIATKYTLIIENRRLAAYIQSPR